jgi:glycosyltransferase involved in cell wall biosynthesis
MNSARATAMARPHIAFFMASMGMGGIGKMRLHLTRELVRRKVKVDLLLGDTKGPYFPRLDPGVRVVNLGTSHSLACLPRLVRYLRREHPDVLITERIRVNAAAIRARNLAATGVRVFAGIHTAMSREIEYLRPEKSSKHRRLFEKYYPQNDGYIAISKGVAQDMVDLLRIAPEKIRIVYNPVVTEGLYNKADEKVAHPWLESQDECPVILGIGRLEQQKDFFTLLRAFAIINQNRPCRLIVLGEGNQRQALQELATELQVADRFDLPGFLDNPYPYLKQASVFAFSSAWEGLGNVLVEALALGTPAVSTDCPSGPREVLQDGRYGALVSVGDATALAKAIEATLDNPLPADELQQAAARFTVENCADSYLAALGFGPFTA